MSALKYTTNNRNSSEYKLVNTESNEQISVLTPEFSINKLFNNDVFIYDATNKTVGEIIESPIRRLKEFPAVLIVANGKTYGREPNKTSTNLGRLYYQCVPNNPTIPIFLVPYDIKQLGFSKSIPNLYVNIAFKEWTNKHPIGTITQLIGAVNQLDHFYEYQLHCKSLNTPLHNFNKAAINALKINKEPDTSDEDRSLWHVFTIDPQGCADYDDAFSVTNLGAEDNSCILVSIYIANVAMWLELLNLWPFVGERTSTIYLPNGKRPMLPAVLGDGICSLKAGEKRHAFTLDIKLCKLVENKYIIESTSLYNCLIQVKRNYVYEERDLLKNADYRQLLVISKELTKNPKYSYLPAIGDSHDVVAYFMLFMNHYCAKELNKNGIGILRRTEAFSLPIPLINCDELCRGEYIQPQQSQIRHESLNLDVYTHITSPIRRIVDLLNMLILQHSLNLFKFSPDAFAFYDKWTNKLEHINETMRKIKRVQNDCELLHMCNKSVAMLDKTYDGHCFDKRETKGMYEYSIYLAELKIISSIRVPIIIDESIVYKCKLYMFNNEEKYKRKIRVQLLS